MATPDPAASRRRFIEELEVVGYGCITNARFRLSPLHAFVGPNDSGKSTVLRALDLVLSSSGRAQPHQRFHDAGAKIAIQLDSETVSFDVEPEGEIATWCVSAGRWGRVPLLAGVAASATMRNAVADRVRNHPGTNVEPPAEEVYRAVDALATWLRLPVFLRLSPDALRLPSALLPRNQAVRFHDEKGTGLPGVLEAIRDHDEGAWIALRERFLGLFSLAKQLRLPSVSQGEKSVEVDLLDGRRVPAELMSEGMLYLLAFLAAAYSDRAGVVLIEEPENGLHPARVAEVMTVLREISKTQQVILATHSPLVLNELEGDEITVLVRTPERGTQGTRLCDTQGYAERSKVYANGELWLSYANGTDEAPLLEGTARE